MMNDSTLLKSNEPPPSTQSTLPLKSLQEILENGIIQKKREMHPSHNKVSRKSVDRDRDNPMGTIREP
jgi:hypothetical protein